MRTPLLAHYRYLPCSIYCNSTSVMFRMLFYVFSDKNYSLKLLVLFILCATLLSCGNDEIEASKSIDNPYYDKAYDDMDQGLIDSAFVNFSKAKDILMEAKDSLNVANCLINMGIIQKDKGDYFGAQETALQALDYLDPTNPDHRPYLSSNYNNIAVATDMLKDYEGGNSYYRLALSYTDDSLLSNVYRNNLAINYINNKQFQQALNIYNAILKEKPSQPKEYARVIANLARTKWLIDNKYNAKPEFVKALQIREQEGDLWGQNSSFAYFTDYYMSRDVDSALYYAQKRYAISKEIRSASDQIMALNKLIKLSPSDSIKLYFERYRELNDSVQIARAAAKNQFAVIRYQVEKNKANNLLLQKDNAEKGNRLIMQRIIMGSVTLFFLIAVVVGFTYYKKRQEGIELEAQNKIKASKLKTSRKVHDVVANGIYRVMTEIEYREDIDRESILDKLEEMYNKSRDISYEEEENLESQQLYHTHITDLLKSFANENRRVLIAGNEPNLWLALADEAQGNIRHVLQELMINMDKHSQANNVVVRFEKNEDQLFIYYSDDGIGIPKEMAYGNGLANTVSRIKSLAGKIIFVDETVKGLKVEIMIPFL